MLRETSSDIIFCPNKQIYDGSLDLGDIITITVKAIFPLEIRIGLVSLSGTWKKEVVIGDLRGEISDHYGLHRLQSVSDDATHHSAMRVYLGSSRRQEYVIGALSGDYRF